MATWHKWGARVVSACAVDDAYHYGSGVRVIPKKLQELREGSRGTCTGFAADKLEVFALDWDAQWRQMQAEGIPILK